MRTLGHLGTLTGLLMLVAGCSTRTPPETLTAGVSPEGLSS